MVNTPNKRFVRFLGTVLLVGVALSGCGGGGSSKAKGATTTTVKFSGKRSAEFCDLDRQFHASYDFVTGTPVPDQLKQNLPSALASLRSMEAVAPGEIRPDVKLLRQRIEAALPVFAAVGYDFTKLTEQQVATLRTNAASGASQRLSQYESQVCADHTGK